MTQKSLFDEDEWFVLVLVDGCWETTAVSSLGSFNSRIEAETAADVYYEVGFETRVVHSVFTQ